MGDFQSVARRYCGIVEGAGASPGEALRRTLLDALVDVYREATRLPEMDPDTDAQPHRMSSDEWSSLFESLKAIFGDDEWQLADALADIYRDLSDGFSLMQRGASPADVLSSWQLSFDIHWGAHAVYATKRLSEMLEAPR